VDLACSACWNESGSCLEDTIWRDSSPYILSLLVSHRTADVVYSLSNSSIISVSNYSTPRVQTINASDLFIGFESIFGPDFSNGTRLHPASANGQLVALLAAGLVAVGYPSVMRLQEFGSILAMPLLFFQQNFWQSGYINTNPSVPVPDLEDDLYIFVDLAEAIIIGVIPKWTVIVYTIISLTIFTFCIIGIYLATFVHGPGISSFPMVDFASRILTEDFLASELTNLVGGKDGDVRGALDGKALFLKHIEGDSENIEEYKGYEKKLRFTME
jgi:hypothetical protein